MQNVYSTPLRYKNFNGVERTTTLHFHLTPREFTDWGIDHMAEANRLMEAFAEMPEDMGKNPAAEMSTEQKVAVLQMIRTLAELSYGKPTEDGEVFDKSDKTFPYSAKYDAFRLFLFEHPNELNTFLETLLNKEVLDEFSEKLGAANATAQQNGEQNGPQPARTLTPAKDPKDMTHEELLEAYKSKNQQ
jgi:hypothetical protein